MAVRFCCTDPLGREITLSDSVWFDHIVRRHSELRTRRAIVQDALTAPDVIHRDRQRPLWDIYYRAVPMDHPFGGLLVRVIVKFYETGEVVTAHFVESPHWQERRK